MKRALERLSRSDALESEVRGTLERNGFAPATVEQVLAVLLQKKLVNDSKTINSLIAQRTGKRAAGIEKMRAELLAKGAPEELIEQGLSSVTAETQAAEMRALLAARCKPTDSPAKGARLLLSRGFEDEAVREAVEEFFRSNDFSE